MAIPAGAQVIDLSDASVLPGLFDCHTHLCAIVGRAAGPSPRDVMGALLLSTLSDTTGYRAILGVANGRSMLEAGFTTVRDVGNAGNYADTDLRRAQESGPRPGADDRERRADHRAHRRSVRADADGLAAGPGAARPPPPRRPATPERPGLGNPEYLYADTRDEMTKAVRENALYGARVIKIVTDDQRYIYSAEDIAHIVSEAARRRAQGRGALRDRAGRAQRGRGRRGLHRARLLHERRHAARGEGEGHRAGRAPTSRCPPRASWALPDTVHAAILDRVRRARAAGRHDGVRQRHLLRDGGHDARCLAASYAEGYVEAGLSPAEILRLMITNPARLLGVEKRSAAPSAPASPPTSWRRRAIP